MTTDTRLRTAARQAALDGSPEARAAWLRERLRSQDAPCGECVGRGEAKRELVSPPTYGRRAGNPEYGQVEPEPGTPCPSCAQTGLTLRPLVELAAYCGDEGARAALLDDPAEWLRLDFWNDPLGQWLSGLSRWGPRVLVRAAIAAARVALLAWDDRVRMTQSAPSEEETKSYLAARRAIEAAEAWLTCPCEEHRWPPGPNLPNGEPEWVWEFACAISDLSSPWPHNAAERLRKFYEHAARLVGEQPVREAIQRALIEWAIS